MAEQAPSKVPAALVIEATLPVPPKGMRAFMIIWAGQLISLIGSGLTSFALGVWIFEGTGRATPFVLTALFGSLPGILLSPLAGAVADRWDRRRIMILADTGAALATLFVTIMIFRGRLEIWHIYLSTLISATFGAFQRPAYLASVTMLVPKKDLGRSSGLMQSSQAVQMLVAPMLAGLLFVTIGLKNIILIDFVTFFFAVVALLLVRIPQPRVEGRGGEKQASLWRESIFGWNYIKARRGLLSMLIYFALANFALSMVGVLMTPLVLSFADADTLGFTQAVFGLGMLLGSLAMSAWGGPKRKMNGVYGFIAIMGLGALVTGWRASTWSISLGLFISLASIPIAAGCSQVIWQTKVAPEVQGRVFAIRGMMATAITPLAIVLAGVLSDRVFEPMMMAGGRLAKTLGPLLGTGPGRGIGLIYMLSGLMLLLSTAVAYLYPRMRLVEDELPEAIPDES
jgi:DHA3 family macrolide efflux protein-like MFS transporter